jgi:hypothetical protein
MRGNPGRRVRIPIAAVMAAIALIAVEMGALRVASGGFVDLSRSLTIVALAVATFQARPRRGDEAAWWFGFAVCGWAYFAMDVDATVRQTAVIGRFPIPVLPPMTVLGFFVDMSRFGSSPMLMELLWNRYEIFQSIVTLVVASIGGTLCWVASRRRGAPFREEERRAGRLELGDDRAEPPASPPAKPS